MYRTRGETDKSSEAADRRYRGLSVVLPWVLIVGVATGEVVSDLMGNPAVRIGSLVSPAPALAAIRGTPRAVLTVSLAALATAAYAAITYTVQDDDRHLPALGAVTVVSIGSLAASRARVRHEEQLSRVQRVAEVAQLALLRKMPDRAGDLRLAARYIAAESEAQIGGDLYEVVVRPRGIRLIIGDVRGKGLPAIRTSAAVLGAFREAAQYEPTLSRIAVRCSEAVARLGETVGEGEESAPNPAELFVTAIVAEIEGPVVRLVNLGHPPPVLLNERVARLVEAPDPIPPLGLAHQLYDDFPVQVQAWRQGDRLLLYTDGIDEARDAGGRFFPLVRCVNGLLAEPTTALPDAVLRAVRQHTGERLVDDAAIVAVEWSRDGGPPRRVADGASLGVSDP